MNTATFELDLSARAAGGVLDVEVTYDYEPASRATRTDPGYDAEAHITGMRFRRAEFPASVHRPARKAGPWFECQGLAAVLDDEGLSDWLVKEYESGWVAE